MKLALAAIAVLAGIAWEDRFWARVDRSGGPDACWPWTGPVTPKGYGQMWVNGKHAYAHRLAYGPMPEGLVTDHLCRNRACCNPAHLEAVTTRENLRRGLHPTEHPGARKAHCLRGHARTPENTYHSPRDGSRHCRTCDREWHRAWDRTRRTPGRGYGWRASLSHCHRGHPFDDANTIRTSRGRECRACREARSRVPR